MSFPLLRLVRSGLALVLGLWVAGAGCLLGCQGIMMAAASERAGLANPAGSDLNLVVSGEACASAKSHDCCAKGNHRTQPKAKQVQRQAATLVETDLSSSGMSACPLAMSRMVVAAKKGNGETSLATAIANANLPTRKLLEQPAPLISQVRLPNRGHTYLVVCSFLI